MEIDHNSYCSTLSFFPDIYNFAWHLLCIAEFLVLCFWANFWTTFHESCVTNPWRFFSKLKFMKQHMAWLMDGLFPQQQAEEILALEFNTDSTDASLVTRRSDQQPTREGQILGASSIDRFCITRVSCAKQEGLLKWLHVPCVLKNRWESQPPLKWHRDQAFLYKNQTRVANLEWTKLVVVPERRKLWAKQTKQNGCWAWLIVDWLLPTSTENGLMHST